MISYIPKIIYVDPSVLNSPITKHILASYPDIPVEMSATQPKFLNEADRFKDPLLEGKKRLWITKNQGKLLKKCGAATSRLSNMVCCNYYILDFAFNCHFECVYCFLQEYTNQPLMIVYANIEEMLASVQETLDQSTSNHIRIGTGEMADSLALDRVTGFSKHLVPFFAKQKRAFLELKTKSTEIGHLLNLDPKGQTVVAWSVNPASYVTQFDLKTASLEERILAAHQCVKAGYKVAFHLDPIIALLDWKGAYQDLIDQLLDQFEPVWLSLGALRFNKTLKNIIRKRFPRNPIVTGEMIMAPDGKKRYVRPLRQDLYQTLLSYIQKKTTRVPTYFCMETEVVWQKTAGYQPASEQDLEAHIVSSVAETC